MIRRVLCSLRRHPTDFIDPPFRYFHCDCGLRRSVPTVPAAR